MAKAQGFSPDLDSRTPGFAGVGDPDTDKRMELSRFFGKPLRPAAPNNGYYATEFTDYGLFDQGWGSGDGTGKMVNNAYLSRVLIEKAKASECWQLTKMAPWQLHTGTGTKIEWNIEVFDQHMLDREPEESTPRLLLTRRESGSQTMFRYGIAFMLEVGFASTPHGVQTYINNLEQIRVATVDTARYGAMVSIFEHTPYSSPSEPRGLDVQDKAALDRMFRYDASMFGIVHKESTGYDTIMNQLRSTMSKRQGGCEGDFTVLPKGMGAYIRLADDSRYYLSGRANSTHGISAHTGPTIVESCSFSTGEGREPHDPNFRARTIGGRSSIDDMLLRNSDVALYRTSHLDINVYNEDQDSFFRFCVADVYKYSGVWNFDLSGAPMTDKLGVAFAYDMGVYTWGQLYRKCTNISRAVDKLLMLPLDKQQAFLTALRVLPLSDARAGRDVASFDRERFCELFDESFQFDKSLTIEQRKNIKRKFEDSPYAEADAVEQGLAQRAKAQRGSQSSAEVALRIVALFVKPQPGDTVVALSQRSILLPSAFPNVSFLAVAPYLIAILTRPSIAEPQRLLLLNQLYLTTASVVRDVTRSVGPDSELYSKLSHLHQQFADSGARPHPTVVNVNESTYGLFVEVQTLIAGVFAPFAAKFDTSVALKGLDDGPSLIERAAAADASSRPPIAANMPGLWNPDNDAEVEDGRVTLAASVASLSCTMGIDSDIFAATLCEAHTVFFTIPTAVKNSDIANLKLSIGAGLTRTRVDSFVHSIVLSYILAGRIVPRGEGDGVAVSFDPTVTNRLKRFIGRRRPLRLLLSQTHMRSAAESAILVLARILADNKFEQPADEAAIDAAALLLDPAAPKFDVATFGLTRVAAGAIGISYQAIACGSAVIREIARQTAVNGVSLDDVMQRLSAQLEAVDKEVFSTVGLLPSQYLALAAEMYDRADPDQHDVLEALVKALIEHYGFASSDDLAAVADVSATLAVAWTRATVESLLDRAALSSGECFRFCIDNDIPLALSMQIWRPSKTYNMGSIIRMQAGAARTFYKNPNMMVAENVAQKTIFGHFTQYTKTAVTDPAKVIIGHNVYCDKYLGGNGVQIWDPLNEEHTNAYRDGEMICDAFVTLSAMKDSGASAQSSFWTSLTGKVPKSLNASAGVNDMMHFPGAAGFTSFWGFVTDAHDFADRTYRANQEAADRKQNVICMREFQIRYDPETKRMDHFTRDAGMWGACIYEGCGKVICGQQTSIFQTPSYHEVKVVSLRG